MRSRLQILDKLVGNAIAPLAKIGWEMRSRLQILDKLGAIALLAKILDKLGGKCDRAKLSRY